MIYRKAIFFLSIILFGNLIYCQKVTEFRKIFPDSTLTFLFQHSNNNIDIAEYQGEYYIGLRTAPTHFASKKTALLVFKTKDLKTFEIDTIIRMGCDIREPRFCVYNNKLHLYFFQGGTKAFKFEPQKIWMITKSDKTFWSQLTDVKLDGYVPWRVRDVNGKMLLSAYYGKDLYNSKHKSDLRLFESTDGYRWKAISKKPQCDLEFAEEGEYVIDRDGILWGTIRFEGFGGALVHTAKNDWTNWNIIKTDYKYDSAILFEHENEIYLISRRNMDGIANKFKSRTRNLIRYSFTKKCTALFKIDKEKKTINHILDFPSTGDNAYAGIVKTGAEDYVIVNYSSAPAKSKNWISGQLGKTNIYLYRLSFNQK
jgi:hypothetical protein